jgi:TctA family transporter
MSCAAAIVRSRMFGAFAGPALPFVPGCRSANQTMRQTCATAINLKIVALMKR